VKPPRAVVPFGDSAFTTATTTQHEANSLAASIRAWGWEGVEDVVAGYRSVTVIADPTIADLEDLKEQMAVTPVDTLRRRRGRDLEVAVCFDGPDLAEVAKVVGVDEERVIEMLVEAELEVAFLGFSPGFAYMTGLPSPLRRLERRPNPRPRVPAGSLGLAGGFAAVYPQCSPGGWNLVGRTPLRLFDPDTPPYCALQPGDVVHLVAIGAAPEEDREPTQQTKAHGRPLITSATRRVEIERSGMLSLVEDRGRIGKAWLGVPRSGAADPLAMRLANRLVGNDDGAAVIEVIGSGPAIRVRSESSVHVAVAGDAQVRIDGLPAAANAVEPLASDQLLSVDATGRGLRAYVAFGGGLQTPVVMGSRSTDLLSGLGPGPLSPGDSLALGPPTRPRGRLRVPPASLDGATIGVIAGPDPCSAKQMSQFEASRFEVQGKSDRVGIRLSGPELRAPVKGITSKGMVTGAIQVPPDGNPIVLLCDHATVGGYPVIATIVRADLARLGQLRPGDEVHFEMVDPEEARRRLEESERELDGQVAGWYPVRTD
jgi:KipI family sensor histidine kinase inhibitor